MNAYYNENDTKVTLTRVGRLRGYGNAVNPWCAKVFIEASLEAVERVRLTGMSGMTNANREGVFG